MRIALPRRKQTHFSKVIKTLAQDATSSFSPRGALRGCFKKRRPSLSTMMSLVFKRQSGFKAHRQFASTESSSSSLLFAVRGDYFRVVCSDLRSIHHPVLKRTGTRKAKRLAAKSRLDWLTRRSSTFRVVPLNLAG